MPPRPAVYRSPVGMKRYELSNHPGNVMTVISDKITPIDTTSDGLWDYFNPSLVSATDYYPFGMEMPGRLYSPTGYRYGMNGQETDPELKGEGNIVNFIYRMHDSRLGRFLSIDPMVKSFPWNSSYAFAENRPIDGRDLEGREWDQATDDQGNTNVTVNTSFSVEKNLGLSQAQITEYQSAISSQLNSTLQISSGGTFSGSATFHGGNVSGRLVPSINLYGDKHTGGPDDPMTGGANSFGATSINLYKKDGSLKSSTEAGVDAVHELLHTLRFEHPFEKTQGADTKLIHSSGNNYLSTPSTDPNIIYNIMNYSLIYIDGKNAGNAPLNLMTKDQLMMMQKEIDLQKQGYGVRPKYDSKASYDENLNRYNKLYRNYWFSTPGHEVQKNK